jgi:hypothetical protein
MTEPTSTAKDRLDLETQIIKVRDLATILDCYLTESRTNDVARQGHAITLSTILAKEAAQLTADFERLLSLGLTVPQP